MLQEIWQSSRTNKEGPARRFQPVTLDILEVREKNLPCPARTSRFYQEVE